MSFRKFLIGLVIPMLLLVNLAPATHLAFAESINEHSNEDAIQIYYVVSEKDETIPIYEDQNGTQEISMLPNHSVIELPNNNDEMVEDEDLSDQGDYAFIQFEDENEEIIEGYVHKEYLLNEDDYLEIYEQGVPDEDATEDSEDIPLDEDATEDIPTDEESSEEQFDPSVEEEKNDTNEDDETELPEGENEQEKIDDSGIENAIEENDKDSAEDKQDESDEETTIESDVSEDEQSTNETPKAQTMQSMSVETFGTVKSSLRGVAKKSPTNIRQTASTKSKIIKQYPLGSVIKYAPHSEHWYRIQVEVNGKSSIGYIHKKHVTTVTTVPKNYKGIAKKATTNVRLGASTKSKIIKQFPIGTVIHYKSFSKNWNEIVVNVNGKDTTGYIHKKHVTNINTTPVNQKAFAIKSPTNVRVGVSTKSKVLTKLSLNQAIDVTTFSKNWVEIKVNINGTVQTGYIHKKHIGNSMLYSGVAAKPITNVRTASSTKSEVLTTFAKGTVIKYFNHNANWYRVIVKINGKEQTGYVHKKHLNERRTVVLDAGHGGYDPGASSNDLEEKKLTLEITKYVQNHLVADGYNVLMTRSDDRYVSLKDRTDFANRNNADIMVSIHINSGGGTGIETWKYNGGPYPASSAILATQLQKNMINSTRVNDRGVQDKNLHINRESKMPSSLVEIGFIDHPLDASLLKQNLFKKNAAKGIANGINAYFLNTQ